MSITLKYLNGYASQITEAVEKLLEKNKLTDFLLNKYPQHTKKPKLPALLAITLCITNFNCWLFFRPTVSQLLTLAFELKTEVQGS